MSGRNTTNDICISKTLSWLLRHGAVRENLPIDTEGFIDVQILLQHKSLRGKCTTDALKQIVASNDKQRFTLRTFGNCLKIRANQGHSLKQINELELIPINVPSEVKDIIHGTSYANWKSIKLHGLNRMKRNFIHCASGLPSDNRVISGMRTSSNVYIYINAKSVLSSGIKLYKSVNGVILCSGNQEGLIETKHFLKVIDASTGKENYLLYPLSDLINRFILPIFLALFKTKPNSNK